MELTRRNGWRPNYSNQPNTEGTIIVMARR